MTPWKFSARLFRPEGPGMMTVLPIPRQLVSKENLRARQRLKGMIDDVQIATSLLSNGEGGFALVINKQLLQGLRKEAGDIVHVSLVRDSRPAHVDVPMKFAAQLRKDSIAKKAFDRLPPSHRKEYVMWINSAKKAETQDRRIRQAIQMLREGRTLR